MGRGAGVVWCAGTGFLHCRTSGCGPGIGEAPPPIGFYRSGKQIEKYMRSCNVDFQVTGSRVPSVVACLTAINNGGEPEKVLPRLIEAAADPRDFANEPERHTAVLDHLNRSLKYDGFELQPQGQRVRLVVSGH